MDQGQTREPDLSRFVIVLCRAEEAGNVGSACRAMKTMGLRRLVLAGAPVYDEDRVRTMAVHAYDLYEAAERFPDLRSALADRSLAAGFTRRRGDRRKTFSTPVDEFAAAVWSRAAGAGGAPAGGAGLRGAGPSGAQGDIALVFGNERSGLSGEEIELCSLAVHIPSSEAFPSLNLAQAVQLACWELRRQAPGLLRGDYRAVSRAEVEAVVARASERLAELGFFRLNQGEELKEFLRDLAERAALSPSELRYFESFIHKMAGLAGKDRGLS